MRSDMLDIVFEPARTNSKYKSHYKGERKAKKDIENLPKRESMSAIKSHWAVERQQRTNFNPVKSYLRGKVGQPWDDVYSDMCKTISKNSYNGYYFFDYLTFIVELSVILIDGVPCYTSTVFYSSRAWLPISNQFYVHPITKCLCYVQENWLHGYRRERKPNLNRIKVNSTLQYHKIKNIWYSVKVKEYTKEEWFRERKMGSSWLYSHYDCCLWRADFFHNKEFYGGYFIGLKKQQLGKRDLKQLRKQYPQMR